MKLFSLESKTALVTGSSQGIGLALAGGLASVGARIIVHGRNTYKIALAANKLRSNGSTVIEKAFDVTDHAATATAVNQI